MRNLIREIFNKDSNFSEEDIKETVIKSQMKESSFLEYKSIHKILKNFKDEKGNCKKEEILIKPLVAFLNKLSLEGGLLILGIYDENHIPKEIAAGPKGLFTSEQIRALIHNNIYSIPSMRGFPNIDIKEINTQKGSIFMIEIHPIDNYTVYFSKISNYVYIRKNDISESFTLPEALTFISEKICAKVFIKIEEKQKENIENIIKKTIGFSYINEGFQPGEWVKSLVTFYLINGDQTKIKIDILKGWIKISKPPQAIQSLQSDAWLRDIIYPDTLMEIGDIKITLGENEQVKMDVTVNEKEGFSTQEFIITSKEIRSIKKEFQKYIDIH